MINLDSLGDIKDFDQGEVLTSIRRLPEQVADAWKQVTDGEVPAACRLAKNVVVSGMGGSALGARIADSLLTDKARSPIEIFTEYRLPDYVNQETLVIASSYSGNTAETLTAAGEAINRGAIVYGVTTGGELARLLSQKNIPYYLIDAKENPSGKPRLGIGYSIGAILAVLARCGFINLLDSEVAEAVEEAKKFVKAFGPTVPKEKNPAKELAETLYTKIPVLVASEHLFGVAHAFKNQLNETAKTFACLFDLPEADHHLLEGLGYPEAAKAFLHFLFFESGVYFGEVKRRYSLTQEVVGKQGVSFTNYHLTAYRKLPQIFEVLILGSFVSFYLALLHEVDPAQIPWVDYFKAKL